MPHNRWYRLLILYTALDPVESKIRRRDAHRHCSKRVPTCGGLGTSQKQSHNKQVFNSFPVFISSREIHARRQAAGFLGVQLPHGSHEEREEERKVAQDRPAEAKFLGRIRWLWWIAMYRLQVYVVECVSPQVCLAWCPGWMILLDVCPSLCFFSIALSISLFLWYTLPFSYTLHGYTPLHLSSSMARPDDFTMSHVPLVFFYVSRTIFIYVLDGLGFAGSDDFAPLLGFFSKKFTSEGVLVPFKTKILMAVPARCNGRIILPRNLFVTGIQWNSFCRQMISASKNSYVRDKWKEIEGCSARGFGQSI